MHVVRAEPRARAALDYFELLMPTFRPLASPESLLLEVVNEVQLPQHLHEKALASYRRITGHLEGSPRTAMYRPRLFCQGSMAQGTTVRPSNGQEFDIDIVCLLQGGEGLSPDVCRTAVLAALREDDDLARRIDPDSPPSCIRLRYADDFHLDVVPAIPVDGDARRIQIPVADDTGTVTWKGSAPESYTEWFLGAGQTPWLPLEGRQVDPAPEYVPADKKYALQCLVQVTKASRDAYYAADDGSAPSSILLTTMLAMVYAGEPVSALEFAVVIDRAVARFGPDFTAESPVYPGDELSSKLGAEDRRRLGEFLAGLSADLRALDESSGMKDLMEVAGQAFGRDRGKAAVERIGVAGHRAKESGRLTTAAAGLAATATRAESTHKPHTFFGTDSAAD